MPFYIHSYSKLLIPNKHTKFIFNSSIEGEICFPYYKMTNDSQIKLFKKISIQILVTNYRKKKKKCHAQNYSFISIFQADIYNIYKVSIAFTKIPMQVIFMFSNILMSKI